MGAPNSPVCQPCHPTVRVRARTTVGALSSSGTRQSGAVLNRYCSLSGVPMTAVVTSARTVRAPLQSTVALVAVAPLGALYSPVAHRTVR
jgi:hypothetical protein